MFSIVYRLSWEAEGGREITGKNFLMPIKISLINILCFQKPKCFHTNQNNNLLFYVSKQLQKTQFHDDIKMRLENLVNTKTKHSMMCDQYKKKKRFTSMKYLMIV